MRQITEVIEVDHKKFMLTLDFDTLCEIEEQSNISCLDIMTGMNMRRLSIVFHAMVIAKHDDLDRKATNRLVDAYGLNPTMLLVQKMFADYFQQGADESEQDETVQEAAPA